MRKIIGLCIAILVIALIGAIGYISYDIGHSDGYSSKQSPIPEVHSTIIVDGMPIEFDKEIELLVRAQTMGNINSDIIEESAKAYVDLFHQHDIVIIEMYRGSLIYHEPSYGYFWLPKFEDDFRDMSIIREKYPRDTDLFFVVPQKFDGDQATITLFESQYWICCFNNLDDIRSFLRYIYSYENI